MCQGPRRFRMLVSILRQLWQTLDAREYAYERGLCERLACCSKHAQCGMQSIAAPARSPVRQSQNAFMPHVGLTLLPVRQQTGFGNRPETYHKAGSVVGHCTLFGFTSIMIRRWKGLISLVLSLGVLRWQRSLHRTLCTQTCVC